MKKSVLFLTVLFCFALQGCDSYVEEDSRLIRTTILERYKHKSTIRTIESIIDGWKTDVVDIYDAKTDELLGYLYSDYSFFAQLAMDKAEEKYEGFMHSMDDEWGMLKSMYESDPENLLYALNLILDGYEGKDIQDSYPDIDLGILDDMDTYSVDARKQLVQLLLDKCVDKRVSQATELWKYCFSQDVKIEPICHYILVKLVNLVIKDKNRLNITYIVDVEIPEEEFDYYGLSIANRAYEIGFSDRTAIQLKVSTNLDTEKSTWSYEGTDYANMMEGSFIDK